MRSKAALALVLAVIAVASAPSRDEQEPSPRFQGKDLPEPPAQKRARTPPKTELPRALLTSTSAMFDAGLADPRGCEYRQVRIAVGNCWSGDGGVVKTHAWVVPAGEGKPRFAVAWNGLVYAALDVGDPADLKADVVAAVKENEAWRASHEKDHGEGQFYRFRRAWSEAQSASHKSLLPIKACLLLRLGEEELASRVWRAWTAGMKENTNDDRIHLRDPYLMVAGDWLWARFDRAVCAHMRGDDGLALLDARALAEMEKAVEADAEKRGFERPERRSEEKKQRYFGFLEPLPALLADQERRARQPNRAAERRAEADNLQSPRAARLFDDLKARRTALLIEEFEEIRARQWGQPGGVSLGMAGVVQQLIAQGDDAVEPLLKCLEGDSRLTRSVQFSRDFHHHREILGVHQAAHKTLKELLQLYSFGGSDYESVETPEGRKKVASDARAYWNRFKGLPIEERWYAVLADDKAAPGHWRQAANNIVAPGRGKAGDAPRFRGESLRRKSDPSVGDLLKKRLTEMGSRPDPDLWHLAHFAGSYADWDGKKSVPELGWLCGLIRDSIAARGPQASQLIRRLADLHRRRLEFGDPKVLDEYTAWIVTMTPKDVDSEMRNAFELMWSNPDHAAVAQAAKKMFTAPSPWVPLLTPETGFHIRDLFETPLVGVPAFRALLIRSLDDNADGGTVTLQDGFASLAAIGWSTSFSYDPADPLAPKPRTKMTFRLGDLYAAQITRHIAGSPQIEFYWSKPRRDEARRAVREFLERYGDALKYDASTPNLDSYGESRPRLHFPRLGRPATAADVARGRAIFAFGADDNVRVWKQLSWPRNGRWITLKEYPYEATLVSGKTGERRQVKDYRQDGVVWQAEEVQQDGKWERHYGFVIGNKLARVPAAEIEFPAEYPWYPLANGFDCQISTPGVPSGDGDATIARRCLDDPLRVTLKLRNRSGVARSVPTSCYRKEGREQPALYPGMRIRLWHAQEKASKGNATPPPIDSDEWQELAVGKFGRLAPGDRKSLKPTDESVAFDCDLRDLFSLTKPGAYRLRVAFSQKDGCFTEGESLEATFSLARSEKP